MGQSTRNYQFAFMLGLSYGFGIIKYWFTMCRLMPSVKLVKMERQKIVLICIFVSGTPGLVDRFLNATLVIMPLNKKKYCGNALTSYFII